MNCPKCQFENPEDAKFCVECGNKIEIICPNCSSSNSPSYKFCSKCGHKLSLASEAPPKDLTFDEKLTKIQKQISVHLPTIQVRIGIKTGEVVRREAKHPFGQAVVIASRIVSEFQGGQLIVSDVTKQLTSGSGFAFI